MPDTDVSSIVSGLAATSVSANPPALRPPVREAAVASAWASSEVTLSPGVNAASKDVRTSRQPDTAVAKSDRIDKALMEQVQRFVALNAPTSIADTAPLSDGEIAALEV